MLSQLLPLFPVTGSYKRYKEPFVGGGAVFFALKAAGALKNVAVELADNNSLLVRTFEVIRSETGALVLALKRHVELHSEEHYYAVRKLDRDPDWKPTKIELAARYLYMNKTGYNGLHRVNRKGQNNVPFGSYENPTICDEENLRAVASALRGVSIVYSDFEEIVKWAGPGDFVYLDSPYAPLSATSSFTAYTADGFGLEDQQRLAAAYRAADTRGAKLVLSNSDCPLVRELYKGYRIEQVQANRAINSKGGKRGKIPEVVVLNY